MKRLICTVLAAVMLLSATVFAAPDVHACQHRTTEELESRWEDLTQRQKTGIYRLLNKRGRIEIEIMNEYARLGLISEEEASAFSARVSAYLDTLERSGDLPPVYGYKPQKRDKPEAPSRAEAPQPQN